MSLLPGYCTIEGCERPRQGTLELCASHAKLERDKERDASKPVKRGGPVKKVSDKRKEQNQEYAKLREAYLKEHPICEICGSEPATEIHHRKGRTNDLLLEVQYFLAVDRSCHQLVTEDSAWAIQEGYSLPRTTSQEKQTI